MWKKLNIIMLACAIALGFGVNTYAEEYYDDDFVEDVEYDDYDSDYDYDYDTSLLDFFSKATISSLDLLSRLPVGSSASTIVG